jgi:RNA polymerase sigma-70 factor, ECF subfamily
MAATDEQLMHRTARGDLQALGELFDRHQAALYRFLCRFLGDPGAAEDVVQEVFWRVWQYRSSFEGKKSFSGWVYTVARNAALDEVRKPYRRACAFADVKEETLPSGPGPGSEAEVRRMALQTQVRAALQKLTPEQRLCVILRDYEEKSHGEIAEILGVSEGNARVMTHRARRALRDLLLPVLERERSEESRV